MKIVKWIVLVVIIALSLGTGFGLSEWKNNNDNPIDEAYKEKEKRFVIVVNEINEVINEVSILTKDGAEIDSVKNPDDETIVFEIKEYYNEQTEFIVRMIDRYDRKYECITNVNPTRETTVKIKSEHRVEEKGGILKDIIDWFNN